MNPSIRSRRDMLKTLGLATGATLLSGTASATSMARRPVPEAFSYCLNTSTIMGQKLGIVAEIELAAKAGYDGIEIWIRNLETYVKAGNSLADLKKRIDDLGIRIEDAIGFASWIVDDNDRRTAALEQAKREMDMLAQIGCRRIAAPPAGATKHAGLDLKKAGERFRALMEVGVQMEVIPQLEVWGFSANLSRLSEVLYVAAECGHADLRILPDAYHLFKGGSDFDGIKLMSSQSVEIFHINDYPDKPAREEIDDSYRVYPGEGVAPLDQIIQDLYDPNFPTVLSLELFNRDYWKQDAEQVARTGLEKMKASVAQAMG